MPGRCFSRRDFLRTVGLGAAAMVFAKRAAAAEKLTSKPNLVFILIDDLGWKDLGCMGSRYYETPNIDKLAGEGMTFTSAYTNGPNCAPTRACIMSGQYSPRHGVYTVGSSERGPVHLRKLVPIKNKTALDSSVVTVAEALKAAGYKTAIIGKWHLGENAQSSPASQGFDVVFESTKNHFGPAGEYMPDVLTDKAVAFIESNKDKSFFLYLSHNAVHTPLQARKEAIEKYKGKPGAGGHNDPTYAAMVESVDQSVGRIVSTLDRLKLADNTAVFFFSDNGGVIGVTSMAPLRGGKGMLYEGGVRVPLIVRWPGKITKPGSLCDVPVMGIDFYPTLLEMAGDAKPSGQILDGESITPLLEGAKSLKREAVFWHFPAYLEGNYGWKETWRTTPAGAVRKGDWKLVEYFEDGRLELYNLEDDIGEKNNLAEKAPEKTKELHELLRQWRKSVNAPVLTEINPKYNPVAESEKKTTDKKAAL